MITEEVSKLLSFEQDFKTNCIGETTLIDTFAAPSKQAIIDDAESRVIQQLYKARRNKFILFFDLKASRIGQSRLKFELKYTLTFGFEERNLVVFANLRTPKECIVMLNHSLYLHSLYEKLSKKWQR